VQQALFHLDATEVTVGAIRQQAISKVEKTRELIGI
jgi:hypothetical protein